MLGLNSREVIKMNKYEQKPEFILDLHGKTTREAREVLDELVAAGEYSHVRIITGKGLYRENGPVMRTFVENYLRQRDVEFDIAKLYNGGDGALEVFLK